jgi:4-diphosphocytidyl-2-C-methyl-D-erythritol kinase
MIAFPCCKINLGLHVISKRSDGYHDIETCFYPIPWNDILEIIPSTKTNLFLTGNKVPGDLSTNIVFKAYQLLKKDFDLKEVEIHLHKIIPTGAGLGGGSSDGAMALKILNELFNLKIAAEKLKEYALQLGSDCPFFLEATPKIATGRGEIMNVSPVNLSGLTVLIVKPEVHVSTAEAYAGIAPKKTEQPLKEILQRPMTEWKNILKNDFEENVFRKHPIIGEIKNTLYAQGAMYAGMSGSGSSVFGLFEKKPVEGNKFKGMKAWSALLGSP